MKEAKNIYVITVGNIIGNQFCVARTPAFYLEKKDAYNTLTLNNADIHEYSYDYAVLERVEEGCYGVTGEKEWFAWSESLKGYIPIDEPESEKHISGYGIG